MEQVIREIIRTELSGLFEAKRKPLQYPVVDADDCLPKNEITPYKVLKRSELKCQEELSWLDALQMELANLLVNKELSAEQRIAGALDLIYQGWSLKRK